MGRWKEANKYTLLSMEYCAVLCCRVRSGNGTVNPARSVYHFPTRMRGAHQQAAYPTVTKQYNCE